MCVKVFPGGATPLCQQKKFLKKNSNEPALSWFGLFKPATHPSICSYRCISHFPHFFKKKPSLIALQTEKRYFFLKPSPWFPGRMWWRMKEENANWLMLFAPAAISAHADVKRSVSVHRGENPHEFWFDLLSDALLTHFQQTSHSGLNAVRNWDDCYIKETAQLVAASPSDVVYLFLHVDLTPPPFSHTLEIYLRGKISSALLCWKHSVPRLHLYV